MLTELQVLMMMLIYATVACYLKMIANTLERMNVILVALVAVYSSSRCSRTIYSRKNHRKTFNIKINEYDVVCNVILNKYIMCARYTVLVYKVKLSG